MRNQETAKHDYGHALLIAGAYGRMGCAILAAKAALRSGCGLVSVHLPSRCVDPMQAAFPEKEAKTVAVTINVLDANGSPFAGGKVKVTVAPEGGAVAIFKKKR